MADGRKIRNPLSGRMIDVGGPTYKRLVKSGDIVPNDYNLVPDDYNRSSIVRPTKGGEVKIYVKQEVTGENYFETLPNENIFDIIVHLEPDDIISYCKTDKRASSFCRDKHFWIKKLDFDFADEDRGLYPSRYINLESEENGYKMFTRFARGMESNMDPYKTGIVDVWMYRNDLGTIDLDTFIKTETMPFFAQGRRFAELHLGFYKINYTVELLETIINHGFRRGRLLMDSMADSIDGEHVDLDVIVYALNNVLGGYYPDGDSMYKVFLRSVGGDRLDIVNHLLASTLEIEIGPDMDYASRRDLGKFLSGAVRMGKLDVARYLAENHNFYPKPEEFARAARNKKIEVLRWMDTLDLNDVQRWGNWDAGSGEMVDYSGFRGRAIDSESALAIWSAIANAWYEPKWQRAAGFEIIQWMVDHGMVLPPQPEDWKIEETIEDEVPLEDDDDPEV